MLNADDGRDPHRTAQSNDPPLPSISPGGMTVLVAGGGEAPLDCCDHAMPAWRILGYVPLPGLASRLAQQLKLEALWLRGSDIVPESLAAEIIKAGERLGTRILCELDGAALDTAFADFGHLDGVQFLNDPTPVERAMALAGAQHIPAVQVADSGRDVALERIDRLQDEVARISALLADMAQAGYGFPMRAADMGGAPIGFSPMLREGGRGYRSEADLAMVGRYPGGTEGFSAPVRRMLRQRRMREQFFPANLFADPAWDMLLDLYAAQLEGQPVAVSSLCIAAAVPATTALRWIKTMTDTGLFERQADPRDGRRIFIGLSAQAAQAMDRYFKALQSA